MVLGKRRPTNLDNSRATALAEGAGGDCLDNFSLFGRRPDTD